MSHSAKNHAPLLNICSGCGDYVAWGSTKICVQSRYFLPARCQYPCLASVELPSYNTCMRVSVCVFHSHYMKWIAKRTWEHFPLKSPRAVLVLRFSVSGMIIVPGVKWPSLLPQTRLQPWKWSGAAGPGCQCQWDIISETTCSVDDCWSSVYGFIHQQKWNVVLIVPLPLTYNPLQRWIIMFC